MKPILRAIRRFLPLALTLLAMIGSAFLADWLDAFFWKATHETYWSIMLENALAAGTILVAAGAFLVTNHDLAKAQRVSARCDTYRDALKSVGADYFDIWKNVLSLWATELGFTASERISVYKHSGNTFLMLGRFSLNPDFARRGRAAYPDAEGCIGNAWRSQSGTCFTNALPDPVTDMPAYEVQQQGDWGVGPATTAGLSMRSRTIGAYSVLNPTATERQAIVVFESVLPGQIDDNAVQAFLTSKGSNQVVLFMDALKFQEPSLELARKEGFG